MSAPEWMMACVLHNAKDRNKMTNEEIREEHNAMLRKLWATGHLDTALQTELAMLLDARAREIKELRCAHEPECKHHEVNPIADTHASWCVTCGAFHDGSQWIDPNQRFAVPTVRVCPDSEDGQHVLKQDGPFSIVYCDACGMNRGWRTQEPESGWLPPL